MGDSRKNSLDLTGQRFGKLVAIRPTEKRSGRCIIWECHCDCGNTAFVPVSSLRKGSTKSCGCITRTDLAGQRFGNLMAVRPTEDRSRNHIVWECLCDCGNVAFVPADSLKHGRTKSCGCIIRTDLTGKRFGNLVAVRPTDQRSYKNIIWECLCDCGNTAYVASNSLNSGNTKSCGCEIRRIENLTGQRFGKLVAVRHTQNRSGKSVVWECLCDCGSTAYVAANSLKSGNTKSCGCLRRKATGNQKQEEK